ncbi:MAG TPA: sugar ABC transporter ATP-binding protein [Frankiaceae bacterium]|nr:sugar ABC transporter ATP-binding protein [Frankiaceae bacterium]
MTAVPLVEIEHLSKTFPGQRALTDVSLTIDRAEIHALVGENGSGKSTLIKVLSGFHLPDPGGRIVIDGEELPFGAPEASRRLGLRFVHQDLALIDQLSAADNVGIESGFRRGRGGRIQWQEQQEHARRIMTNIGVKVDVRRPVAELRPVDRSTIAIARALDDAQGAIRLLVLDEPTAALPPAEVDALFRVLRDVAASGVSILYVSHRLDEILGLASRVSVLRDGTFRGTQPAAGMQRQHLIRLIVGEDSTTQVMASQQAAKTRASFTGSTGFAFEGIRTDRLAGVDLSVGQGEILGVAGLTGSGREEMAAALCGAIPAELMLTTPEGSVHSGMTPRKARQLGIALVLANRHPSAAIRQFTVRENVTLPVLKDYAHLGRINTANERDAVRKAIRSVDLRPPDPDRAYELLSGGNKQKTILAKWLNTSPKLLVLDDPTSGVDIGARHAIYDLVRERTAQGVSVVICSSDIEDLVGVCDRVVTFVAGNVSGALIGDQITEEALLDAILRAAGDTDPVAPAPAAKEL